MVSDTIGEPDNLLGRTLHHLRKRSGLSQEQLGKLGNSSRGYVSMVERGVDPNTGRPPNVSRSVLESWGRVLGENDRERRESTETLLRIAGYATPGAQPAAASVTGPTAPTDDFARAVAAEVTKTLRELIDTDPRLRRVVPVRHDQQRIPADGTAPMDDVYTDLPSNADRLVALTVRGHCMEPDIRDGETVIIDTERPAELKDVVAVYLEGDWTLKRLRKRNGIWLLVPDNADYEPIEIDPTKVRVLGVVVQVSRGKP